MADEPVVTTRDIGYIAQGKYARDLPSFPGIDEAVDSLLPGDLILCRNEGSELTRLIEILDGFFSHVCVYVGEGKVVHALLDGIVQSDLRTDFGPEYVSLGWARPAATDAIRTRVGEWAIEQVDEDQPIPYSAVDLGQTTALLARAHLAVWRDHLPPPDAVGIQEAINVAEKLLESDDEPRASTCAGFAWRAWSAADSPIVPRLANGTLLSGGMLRDQTKGASLLEWLDGDDPSTVTTFEDPQSRSASLSDADWAKWKKLAKLGLQSVPGLVQMVRPTKSFPLHNAVAPGDLWCSPTITDRGFLSPAYRQHAVDY